MDITAELAKWAIRLALSPNDPVASADGCEHLLKARIKEDESVCLLCRSVVHGANPFALSITTPPIPLEKMMITGTIDNPCECSERDGSYTCDYCKSQGHYGHMERSPK